MTKLIRMISAANDDRITTARLNPAAKIARWIKISGVASTLRQLDDRTLDDIGIARGDIQAYAEKLISTEHNTAA